MTDDESIQRLLFDYAWACDNRDWKLLRSLFTDDARLDYSSTSGPDGSAEDAFAYLEGSLSQIGFIQHVVSNFQIDVTGDQAAGRAMFLTPFRLPGSSEVVFTGGYYELEFTRTDGRWRIRVLVEDNRWMSQDPQKISEG